MPISAFWRVYRASSAAPLLLALASLWVQPEVSGFAEIREPITDQAVQGVVSLVGTATHPSFESYRLEFGYDPDPTDTWFPIGEPISTPVRDGRLAIWDTSRVSDGVYRIRLTVQLESEQTLVATVSGIRVRNYTPTEVPATPPTAAAAAQVEPTIAVSAEPLAAAPEAAPDQRPRAAPPNAVAEGPTADQPAQSAPPDPFAEALTVGVAGALAIMATLAGYLWLAPRARSYAAYLKTRRLHRRVERERGGGRRA